MSEKEAHKLYMREYRARDPEKTRAYNTEQSRKWKAKNPERYRIIGNICSRNWKKKNPEKVKLYKKRSLKNNPHTALANRIRDRINRVLKGNRKSDKTFNLVGCSPLELKVWIEKQFRAGMSWQNRGKIWHIDHKRPCASFDLSDPAQQRACFHFTNLQPLLAQENLAKGSKVYVLF